MSGKLGMVHNRPNINKHVGGMIAKACKSAGISYTVLADMLGVYPSTVTRWVTGYYVPPAYELYKIAIATEKPMEWFMNGADPDDIEATRLTIKAYKSGVQEI